MNHLVAATQDSTSGQREHLPNFGKPELRDLIDALYYKVDNEWKILCIRLGMGEKVDSIEENFKDSKKCLLEVLRMWLKQVNPPPTWAAIIDFVEFLGEKQLGRELREKYSLPQTEM